MGYAVLILVAAGNLAAIWVWLRRIHPQFGWMGPISIFFINYLMHYPVRAAFILLWDHNTRYFFTVEEIAAALSYALIFVAVLFAVFLRHSGREHSIGGTTRGLARGQAWYLHLLVVIYFVGFAHTALLGRLFSLGAQEDLEVSVVAARFVTGAKWFTLGYAALLLRKERSWIVIGEVLAIAASIMVSAVASSSKGDVVSLLILLLLWGNLTLRPLPKWLVACAAIAAAGFGVFSFMMRTYGTVSDKKSSFGLVRENLERAAEASEDRDSLQANGVDAAIDRFMGVDGLTLCQRAGTFLESGEFRMGSMAELVLLIPRFVWPERPKRYFNVYLTHAVWGGRWDIVSHTPIGRIGESFFVLNWAGVSYAVIYGLLWAWLHRRLWCNARSAAEASLYVSLLYCAVFTDDNLFSNGPTIVALVAIAAVGAAIAPSRRCFVVGEIKAPGVLHGHSLVGQRGPSAPWRRRGS